MRSSLALGVLLLAAAPNSAQETLRRVRIASAGAPALAKQLEARGHDVLEGSIEETAFELVLTIDELAQLEREGLAPEVIEVGQPLPAKYAADGVPSSYQTLLQIYSDMALAEALYPGLARMVDLTDKYSVAPTFEGRHIFALKISDNVDLDEDEPTVLVVSAHHPREVVTPVIALKMAEDWLGLYGTSPALTAAIDENELWIAPVWNPDGYEYVFQVDNLWRKNRRVFEGGVGVDLNRNYSQGWGTSCAGSDDPTSELYKGPFVASEAETQTMIAFAVDRHFAKVIDFHSSGQEVLWGYSCLTHPFASFLLAEAIALSNASGYLGAERPPGAEGEHYQWEFGQVGAHAFLIETAAEFQPAFVEAEAEADQVLPGVLWMSQRELPISGHVTDACTGQPMQAVVELVGVPFPNGEKNRSGGPHGRYNVFVPDGAYTLEFTAFGFETQSHPVVVTAGNPVVLDVSLFAIGTLAASGPAQPGTTLQVDFDMPADDGAIYIGGAGISGTSPGIPIGGCNLPLNYDALTTLSSTDQYPFAGFVGSLDGAGHAVGTVDLPDAPIIVGLGLDFAFLTLDAITSEFLHTSDGLHVVVLP